MTADPRVARLRSLDTEATPGPRCSSLTPSKPTLPLRPGDKV
jgi:hypothetical protein